MADVRVVHLKGDEGSLGGEELYELAELAEEADGVIAVGFPSDPCFWECAFADLERVGARWPRIVFVDETRDSALSSLSVEELVALWTAYLEEAAKYVLHVDLGSSGRFSRRDLLRRGLSLALRYRPLVDADAGCYGLRHCLLCLTSCPYSALDGKPPAPVKDRCTGCGLCASSCPSGFLFQPAAPPSAVRKLIAMASEKGVEEVIVVCPYSRSKAYETPGRRALAVQLPCIASLRVHEYLYARVRRLRVSFLCSDRECPRRLGAERYLEVIAEVEELFGKPLAPAEPAFFALPALASMLEIKAGEARVKQLSLFYVSVDSERCSLCSACARACPSGALKSLEPPGSASLLFTSSLCVGCGSCAATCPEKAVNVERGVKAGALKPGHSETLVRGEIARCRLCGSPIGPLARIRAVERRLKAVGAPREAIETLYVCGRCRSGELLKELAESLRTSR